MSPRPWHRSDLTALDLGRALILIYPHPHVTLSTFGPAYVVTSPGPVTRSDLTAAELPGYLAGLGVPMPSGEELAWVAGDVQLSAPISGTVPAGPERE